MRFIVDAQLPPALAKSLCELGHEADHVNRIGLGQAPDTEIWRHVERNAAVLLTKDVDFLVLARARASPGIVVRIRIGNVTKRALVISFVASLPKIIAAIEAGERVIDFR